jgi:hypothetical protein
VRRVFVHTVTRAGVALAGVLAIVLGAALPAAGYWTAAEVSGNGIARTDRLAPPTNVTVPATSTGTVAVSWTASAPTLTPEGYYVRRTSGGVTTAGCGSSSTNLITGTSCTDAAVPPGSYTYTVVAVYLSWTATSTPSSTVVVTAQPQGSLTFTENPQSGQRAGEVIGTVIVKVTDASGHQQSGVAVTLTLSNNSTGGTLSGTRNAVSDQNGEATFRDLSVDKVGTYTLTATSPGLAAVTSTSFTVVPNAPKTLSVISGDKQTTKVSTAFPAPLVVRLTDAFGNVVPGVQIIYRAPVGGASATFPGGGNEARITTDATGTASTSVSANSIAGSYAVTVEAGTGGTNTPSFMLTNTSG